MVAFWINVALLAAYVVAGGVGISAYQRGHTEVAAALWGVVAVSIFLRALWSAVRRWVEGR